AARKTDGERVGTEYAFQLLQHAARFLAPRRLLDGAAAHKFDEARLQVEMSLPEFAVIHVVNAIPDFGFAAAKMPTSAEMAIVKAKHLRRQPGRDMNPVRNVSDGNRVLLFAGIKPGPHGARDFTVQRRNCIGAPREPQAEHGHAEAFVAFRVLASQRHETLTGKTEGLAHRSEVLFDQVGVEAIVTGGHGSV